MGEDKIGLVLGYGLQSLQGRPVLWISCGQQIRSSCVNRKWRLLEWRFLWLLNVFLFDNQGNGHLEINLKFQQTHCNVSSFFRGSPQRVLKKILQQNIWNMPLLLFLNFILVSTFAFLYRKSFTVRVLKNPYVSLHSRLLISIFKVTYYKIVY